MQTNSKQSPALRDVMLAINSEYDPDDVLSQIQDSDPVEGIARKIEASGPGLDTVWSSNVHSYAIF